MAGGRKDKKEETYVDPFGLMTLQEKGDHLKREIPQGAQELPEKLRLNAVAYFKLLLSNPTADNLATIEKFLNDYQDENGKYLFTRTLVSALRDNPLPDSVRMEAYPSIKNVVSHSELDKQIRFGFKNEDYQQSLNKMDEDFPLGLLNDNLVWARKQLSQGYSSPTQKDNVSKMVGEIEHKMYVRIHTKIKRALNDPNTTVASFNQLYNPLRKLIPKSYYSNSYILTQTSIMNYLKTQNMDSPLLTDPIWQQYSPDYVAPKMSASSTATSQAEVSASSSSSSSASISVPREGETDVRVLRQYFSSLIDSKQWVQAADFVKDMPKDPLDHIILDPSVIEKLLNAKLPMDTPPLINELQSIALYKKLLPLKGSYADEPIYGKWLAGGNVATLQAAQVAKLLEDAVDNNIDIKKDYLIDYIKATKDSLIYNEDDALVKYLAESSCLQTQNGKAAVSPMLTAAASPYSLKNFSNYITQVAGRADEIRIAKVLRQVAVDKLLDKNINAKEMLREKLTPTDLEKLNQGELGKYYKGMNDTFLDPTAASASSASNPAPAKSWWQRW